MLPWHQDWHVRLTQEIEMLKGNVILMMQYSFEERLGSIRLEKLESS